MKLEFIQSLSDQITALTGPLSTVSLAGLLIAVVFGAASVASRKREYLLLGVVAFVYAAAPVIGLMRFA